MDPEITYRIAFASLRGMNPALARQLLARVPDERTFFEMPARQLAAVMGFGCRIFDDAYRHTQLERARREADFISSSGRVRAVYFTDEAYPQRLSEIDDAPLMLFTIGDCDLNSEVMLSVVGTRHATPYGLDFVAGLIDDLAAEIDGSVAVVSGLALGIDAAAHKTALKRAVPTVGVLAHGLNMIYPSQHRSLAASIIREGGALVTEYGVSDPVHKGNFIARNRIVAGLSDCVVVAESAAKGGALITAGLASGYNRDVFALPGRTSDPYSAGCNALINGNIALLVRDASDIIKAMNWRVRASAPNQPSLFPELSDEERLVVELLTQHGEMGLNQFSVALGKNVGRVMSLLVDMEFKGLLLSYPGGKYRLA